MISEESCDTEDWRNDAENISHIKTQIILNCNIFLNYSFYYSLIV